MGLVDNTLQTESTKVVSSSNCGYSEEKSGKITMENGHCDLPKYKRRKISAVREFPPGCGRFALRISSIPNEEAVCVGKVENRGHQETNCDASRDDREPGSECSRVLETRMITRPTTDVDVDSKEETPAVSPDLVNGLDSSNATHVKMPTQRNSDDLSNAGAMEQLKPVEHEMVDKTKELSVVDAYSLVELKGPRKYPPRRRISAVRDFPPLCGRHAPSIINKETENTLFTTEEKCLGKEQSVIEEEQEKQVLKTDVKQMVDIVPNGDVQNHNLEQNVPSVFGVHVQAASEGTVSEFSINKAEYESTLVHEMNPALEDIEAPEVACGLLASVNDSWKQVKRAHGPTKLAGVMDVNKGNGDILTSVKKKRKKKKNLSPSKRLIVDWNAEEKPRPSGKADDSRFLKQSHHVDVTLPPSCPSSSSGEGHKDDAHALVTRNKVRETLRLFQVEFRKLVKEHEAKLKKIKRPDYAAAKILKDQSKYVNTKGKIIGPVPGVEVGDEFQYRVELNIIGLHHQIQGGIDFVLERGCVICTSIVASGGYDDDMDDSDVLIYTGSGGMKIKAKEAEDQKLERGNLALKNSKDVKNPVRVIRGDTRSSESSSAKTRIYIYDGLYLVEKCWQEVGPHGKLVFKFKLVRIPGQPELAWKVLKKSKKFKVREGLCVDDISGGRELIHICAVNTIDDEKPSPFEYITHVIYPDWCRPIPPKGCDCINGCSETVNCSCVAKNGNEIPYNHDGAIVQAKSLVYECGPSCKCPPSCYNRVSQLGIKFQLEIFKTESRGWGVRSLNSVPSGSFICEYVGELLEDTEAEQRTGNDEYLFDIGNNNTMSSSYEAVEECCFTIDAAEYGNIGRFINHSCSPNLYAQNVLYDHEDKRIPHIMLFAADNIPPLQELTYHYNYNLNAVLDSDGNVKRKNCYCGASECTGRMY